MHARTLLNLVTVALASVAFAQDPSLYVKTGPPDPNTYTAKGKGPADMYQAHYATNLNIGDSVINITNTGSEQFSTFVDNLCVNVYTFDQSEEMLSCCSCLVTPNGLVSLSVQNDLVGNTLSKSSATSVVVKLVATDALNNGGGFCGPGNIDPDGNILAAGMRAWGTTLHALPNGTYGLAESEFLNGGLSMAELVHITSFCEFIQKNGSGYGTCKSCRYGGLAGATQ